MIEHQENLDAAANFLVSIGTLQECEYHQTIYEGDGDLDRVLEIARAEQKKRDNGRVPWAAGMETSDFTDLLKQAYENHCADSCYSCDKWAKE